MQSLSASLRGNNLNTSFPEMLGWPLTVSCILVFMIPVLALLKGSLSSSE